MKKIFSIFILALFMLAASCKDDNNRVKDESYMPEILAENFTNSTDITNTYYPLPIGRTMVYEGLTEDGLERIEVYNKNETKIVMGITCATQNDKVWLEGELIEDTDDWVAQDNEGNLWYFGEAVDNYENGQLHDHDGAWEAGVDTAQPGFWMPANPSVGLKYRQEYYFDEAEDEAEVVEVGLTITVSYGTFTDCIKTRDFTELEKNVHEFKYYAPNIGLILEEGFEDGQPTGTIELIDIQ